MSISSIPQELVDLIVDHFHDDRPSLDSCSYISLLFLHSARRYQFARIKLAGSECRDVWKKFLDLISGSPYILSFIQSLHIVLGSYCQEAQLYLTDVLMRDGFTNVRSLTLEGEKSSPMIWDKLSEKTQRTFMFVFLGWKLERISLDNVHYLPPFPLFMSLFQLFGSSLKEFSLKSLVFTEPASVTRGSVETPIQLEAISLVLNSDMLRLAGQYLCSPHSRIDFSRGRRLFLFISDWDAFPIVQKLVGTSYNSLESLDLQLLVYHKVDLSKQRNLTTLRLTLHSIDGYAAWLVELFKTLPSSGSMKEIFVSLDSVHFNANQSAWSTIDDILTHADRPAPSPFLVIKTISDELHVGLIELMPAMHNRGLLKVGCI